MTKLVTDNQGRKIALIARSLKLPHAVLRKAFSDGTVEKFLQSLVPQDLLKFVDTIEVELPYNLNPAEYYRDKPDRLYVRGGFGPGGDLLLQAPSLPKGTKFRLNVHDIAASYGATDTEIEAALGKGYLFDAQTVCGFYAAMMYMQPNGEAGHLLTNGYANLAYTSSSVASVRHGSNGRRWHVRAGPRVDHRWPCGRRVFSPATAG